MKHLNEIFSYTNAKAAWSKRNRIHVTTKTAEWRTKAKVKDPKRFFMVNILDGRKYAAKIAGVPFEVSKKYAMSLPSDVCPVFGVKLEWGTGSDNTGSFDRIVPNLGYVEGNVCWMSKRANILKRDSSFEEVQQLYEWYIKISETHLV